MLIIRVLPLLTERMGPLVLGPGSVVLGDGST